MHNINLFAPAEPFPVFLPVRSSAGASVGTIEGIIHIPIIATEARRDRVPHGLYRELPCETAPQVFPVLDMLSRRYLTTRSGPRRTTAVLVPGSTGVYIPDVFRIGLYVR